MVVLVAGLVIWRVADPPSTGGSAVAGGIPTGAASASPSSDDNTDSEGTGSTADSGTEQSGTGESNTTESNTAESNTGDAGTSETAPTRTAPATGTTPSGILRVGLENLPSGTDPATDTDFAGIIWRQIFDTLTTYRGAKPTAAPDLAESWQPTNDAKQWTFRIADGHTFSDSAAVTGKAICANFDFWNTRKRPDQDKYFNWQYYFGGFAGDSSALYRSCAADGDSVVLTFARPLPALPDILAQTSFSIHSPDSLGRVKPVGSGAFTWVAGTTDRVTLRAADGGQAHSRTLEFVAVPDQVAMVQAVRNGEAQLAYTSHLQPDIRDVKLEPDYADQLVSLNLYGSHGALADDAVRRAVVAAIDRTALARVADDSVATSVLPEVFGAPKAQFPRTSPAAAKSALKGKKLTLTLAVRGNSQLEPKMAEVVVNELQKVGVTVKQKKYTDLSEYYQGIGDGSYDLSFGQMGGYMGDIGDYLTVYQPPGPYGAVLPAKTKGALAAAVKKALDQPSYQARRKASTAVLSDLLEQNAVIPLVSTGGGWLVGKGITGFERAAFGAVALASVTAD